MHERILERVALDRIGQDWKHSHEAGLVLGLCSLKRVVHRQHGSYRTIFDECLEGGGNLAHHWLTMTTAKTRKFTWYASGGGPECSMMMCALSLSSGGNLLFKERTESSTMSDMRAGMNLVTRLGSSFRSANWNYINKMETIKWTYTGLGAYLS